MKKSSIEVNDDTATDTTDHAIVHDVGCIRGIVEEILDSIKIENEQAKKNSSIKNEGEKIGADVTIGDAVTDNIKINEEINYPEKHIHASFI